MRTLDPDLPRLRQILRSRKAPIWIVQTAPLNSWDIDRGDALRSLLTHRYRRAAPRRAASRTCAATGSPRASARRHRARPRCRAGLGYTPTVAGDAKLMGRPLTHREVSPADRSPLPGDLGRWSERCGC